MQGVRNRIGLMGVIVWVVVPRGGGGGGLFVGGNEPYI